jgi:hypothetical protein
MTIATQTDNYSSELRHAACHLRHEKYYFQSDLLRDDDIFLASYPRSGNHFVSYVIISALHYLEFGSFPVDCFALGKAIPGIHGADLSSTNTSPRIIKTHFSFDPRYRNVIHIIRDPRDVVVSYYHYTRSTPQLFFSSAPGGTDEFVDLFLSGMVWPCDLRFHTESFVKECASINYIQIRYEKLLNDPSTEITRLLGYLNLDLNDQVISKLVAHTSFANMSRIRDPSMIAQRNMLRRGVVGGYLDELKKNVIEKIEDAYEEYLNTYGYT